MGLNGRVDRGWLTDRLRRARDSLAAGTTAFYLAQRSGVAGNKCWVQLFNRYLILLEKSELSVLIGG